MKFYIVFILTLFCLGSCNDSNIESYVSYVNDDDNGLVSRIWNENFYLTAQYLPPELQVIQQIKRGLSKDLVEKELNELENHHYFLLSIESDLSLKRLAEDNGHSWNDTMLDLQYHSKTKFKVRNGRIDYPCVLYHSISGLTPQRKIDFILVFLNDKPSKFNDDLVLVFEDDLFTDEVYELIITKEALQNIPQIELI